MSQTIQEKLDKIYDTKLQIKTALGTSSDVFEDYPAYIRDLTYGGAVSYSYLDERLSYYVETTDLESMGYATESYVYDFVNTYAPSPDLSAYVTKTELNSAGYISSVPSDYPTYAAIEAMGYATTSQLGNYLPLTGGTVDNLNITYTYFLTVDNLSMDNSIPIKIRNNGLTKISNTNSIAPKTLTYEQFKNENNPWVGGTTMINYVSYVLGDSIVPKANNTYTFGDASYLYSAAYISSIYTDNIYNNTGKTRILTNDRNFDLWTNNKKLINLSDYNGFIPMQSNFNLGSSASTWGATYTNNLYADNAYTYNNYLGSSKIYHYSDNYIYIDYANGKRLIISPNTIYASSGLNLGTNKLPINNIYTNSTYIHSETYLPTNTYWWNGTSYVWLGSLFS